MKIAYYLALVLIASCVGQVRADELHRHARLLCDSKNDLAVIQFAESYNDDPVRWMAVPEGIDQGLSGRASAVPGRECLLNNSTRVAFEQGADQAYPYGQCGASPPDWVNLWVGGKQVLRRASFGVCDGQYLHSVIIGPKEITLCRFADEPSLPGENEHRPVACEPLAKLPYPGLPDYDKYPPKGDLAQKDGDVYLRYSAVPDARCWKLREAKGGWQDPPFIRRLKVDIDNDGKIDNVFMVSRRSHADDGDRLYVISGKLPSDEELKGEDAETILERASDFAFSGHNTIMNTSYSYIEILNVGGRTFISLVPVNQSRTVDNVIYEGDPRQRLRTVCIFSKR